MKPGPMKYLFWSVFAKCALSFAALAFVMTIWLHLADGVEPMLLSWAITCILVAIFLLSSLVAHFVCCQDMIWSHKKQLADADERVRNANEEAQAQIDNANIEANERVREAEERAHSAEEEADLWEQTLRERTSGFPTLVNLLCTYEQYRDQGVVGYLAAKKHAAPRAADYVQEASRQRRDAQRDAREAGAIIDYYETLAPWLVEYKNEPIEDDETRYEGYTDEELDDPVTAFMPRDEYFALPSDKRNQLALERYWSWRKIGPREIGRTYERYVGFLFEQEGYDVRYEGIGRGLHDLGIDLECRQDRSVVVVQCKNWKQFSTIYERHIFQLFGTSYLRRDDIQEEETDLFGPTEVRAMFVTSTTLSDDARRIAGRLNIEVQEEVKLDLSYPCIKCNVSRTTGERIYHLPFDQQYDNVKIEKARGEFYCQTVAEAAKAGFRRAYKHRATAGGRP